VDRIDMVDHIFGIASIGGEPVGPVAFCSISVIEAGGIVSTATVEASATPKVSLDGHSVSCFKLVHRLSQRRDLPEYSWPGINVPYEGWPGQGWAIRLVAAA
jgi:hypothetical protein